LVPASRGTKKRKKKRGGKEGVSSFIGPESVKLPRAITHFEGGKPPTEKKRIASVFLGRVPGWRKREREGGEHKLH